MPAISDPRVQHAIRAAYQKRARKRNRAAVAAAIERAGVATLREIVELTGLDAHDCGAALDNLQIVGRVVQDRPGLFGWAGKDGDRYGPERNSTSAGADAGGHGRAGVRSGQTDADGPSV